MKKFIILISPALVLLVYLTVSATSPSAPTCTVHFRIAPDLAAGDLVMEEATDIGSVTQVERQPNGGMDVEIRLDPRFLSRLRQKSTFLLIRLPDHTRPVLSLQVLDEDSPPLPPGGVLEGVNSETELAIRREMIQAEKALRAATHQIENFQRTLEGLRSSPERKELENSLSGLFDALRHFQQEAERMMAEEFAKMKKRQEKPAP